MPKFLFFLIAFVTLSFSKAQTLIDTFNVNPNPFYNRTTIIYGFSANDTVSIQVINLIGQTILSPLTNSIMSSGIYTDSLIMDAYPPGIYYAILKLGHRKALTAKLVKQAPVGLPETSNDPFIKVYPNPLINQLTIEDLSSGIENRKLTITTVLGNVVYSSESMDSKQAIDLSHMSGGIYFLRIQKDSEQKIFKIVKE